MTTRSSYLQDFRDHADDDESIGDLPPGWRRILEDLHEELGSIDLNYRVFYLGTRNGAIRAIVSGSNTAEIQEAVERAIVRSRSTCQICGSPGVGYVFGRRDTRGEIVADKRETYCRPCGDAEVDLFTKKAKGSE